MVRVVCCLLNWCLGYLLNFVDRFGLTALVCLFDCLILVVGDWFACLFAVYC